MGNIEDLLSAALPAWHGASILSWCSERQAARQLLEGAGAQVWEVDEPGLGAEDAPLFDGALAIDVLAAVPPDEQIDALRWLHDRLNPGAMLAVRVSTDLIGERAAREQVRFCAATYMTAFRRAGFNFERLDRELLDEDDPALVQARERMRFHDPLELRTAALDALLVRPDRTGLADLALAEKR